MMLRPPDIWLLSGLPAGLRAEVAHLLATRLDRAAHVEGDRLAEQVVSGRVLPGEEPRDEADRQVELAVRNQCLLARSYAEAGVTPVLDYFVADDYRLEAYRNYLLGAHLHFVVLDHPSASGDALATMRARLYTHGLWLDPTPLTLPTTAEAILARRDEALLR